VGFFRRFFFGFYWAGFLGGFFIANPGFDRQFWSWDGNTDKTYKQHAACLPSGVHSPQSFDGQFWSWDGNTGMTY
jgi:hypothetical protein